jgi:endoglucanase
MKNLRLSRFWSALALLAGSLPSLHAAADAPAIRLNTLGYLPGAEKRATLSLPATEFTLVKAGGNQIVFTGKTTGPITNIDTRESVYMADFTAFRTPGEYLMRSAEAGESAPFSIMDNLYREPFITVTRAMYLWRCGTAVTGTHQGSTFAHGPCHLEDAWLDAVGGGHTRQPSPGGWHDAGDYNKYVVNAGITVGAMLRAWEDFTPALRPIRLGLPESGGRLPDFLAEIKWETDWLLTMQATDGSVFHKVSTRRFGGFVLPERESAERLFVPWSSAATADLVAILAQAARCFRPFDPDYAKRCLEVARKSQQFLDTHPENHDADQNGFETGRYPTRDADDRAWALAELWESTGEAGCLQALEVRLRQSQARVSDNFDWSDVGNLAVFTYLRSARTGRSEALVKQATTNLVATAQNITQTRSQHGYGRPLGRRYNWGCNGTVARQTLVLATAHRLAPQDVYRETALDALNHLFGRNVHGRSYVTGLGHRPPMFPHDRRSGGDKVDAPWPGYLIGGPHPQPANWNDSQDDYRTNEIAINWNGALIYALAMFVEAE